MGCVLVGALALGGRLQALDAAHTDRAPELRREPAVVGSPAPDFSVMDTGGDVRSLAALHGTYVVLEWFNPDCPFVRKHYDSGNMQRLQWHYTSQGVVWLTVDSSAPGKQGHLSADEADAIREQKYLGATAILLDPEGTLGRLYGAKTTPHMFVISPEGVLLYAGAIDDRPSTDPKDLAGATNYVEEALDHAMAGTPVPVQETKSYGCSVKY